MSVYNDVSSDINKKVFWWRFTSQIDKKKIDIRVYVEEKKVFFESKVWNFENHF